MGFKDLNIFARIPSILSILERNLFPTQLREKLGIVAEVRDILTATNSPSYDSEDNYENMELIGDSVLKFITCYALYHKNPDYSESKLTQLKSNYVSNYNIMQLGERQGL